MNEMTPRSQAEPSPARPARPAATGDVLWFWRQVVGFLVGTVEALSVIGLMTVLRWIDALSH